MSNKQLGIFALIGAPWLFIGMTLENKYPALLDSRFTGAWGIFYITGWMCSVIVMQRMKVTGDSKFGKGVLWVLLISLTIANISNVVQIIVEKDKPFYFVYIDMFWPLSNIIMLVAGITVIIVRRLEGWYKYVPLAVGLWFPLAIASMVLIGRTPLGFFFGGLYSGIMWVILAIMIIILSRNSTPAKFEVN